jgi:hypothetical protein
MVHVFKALLSLTIGLTCLQSNAQVIQERFKRIPVTEMTPPQKQYFEAIHKNLVWYPAFLVF